MASRTDAEHAWHAWKQVQEAKSLPGGEPKVYRSLLRSAGSDIITNGLGQTLAFYASKGVKDSNIQKKTAHGLLLDHLAAYLQERGLLGPGEKSWEIFFETFTGDLPFGHYRLLVREALGNVTWAKRFAEAILPKPEQPGEAEGQPSGE